MLDVPPGWNRLTESVIGAAMEVHSVLGPGLLERLYEDAMAYELRLRQIPFERQVRVRLRYKDIELGEQVADLVVGGIVVVELKSVSQVPEVHLAQLVSQLRSLGAPLGLLINFNVAHLRDGLYRRVHSRGTPLPEGFIDSSLPPRPRRSSAPSAFSSSGEDE